MKYLIYAILYTAPALHAIDENNTYAFPFISGNVVAYSWRSGYDYTRVESVDKGSVDKTTFSLKSHCFILLDNVKGLDLNKMQQITNSFVNGEPADRICVIVNTDKQLYIRINLDKQPDWGIGDKLLMEKCVVSFDGYGSGFAAEKIYIVKLQDK